MTFWLSFCVFLILGANLKIAIGEGDEDSSISKVSDFKAKLAKAEKPRTLSDASETAKNIDSYDNASISELGISVPPEYANDTIVEDHHTYYNSTFYADPEKGKQFWVDLNSLPQHIVITHDKLSDSYRQATTIELTFDFPFYGSLLRNITVATGGFLYLGDYLHNWIAATQYIAPLMANFDTSLSDQSTIKYADNGTAFIVQWDHVYIQNRLNDGAFTFQAALLKNGDIIFSYKDIPYPVSNISDSFHPVKIGISDAYILERSMFFMKRKTVYEYHRVQFTKQEISNNTALYFTALPTCIGFKDCSSCLVADITLECSWCEAVHRCSDGMDRLRQDWVVHGCAVKKEAVCPTVSSTSAETDKLATSSYAFDAATKSATGKSTTYRTSNSEENLNANSNDIQASEMNFGETAHFSQDISSESSMSVGAIVTIVAFLAVLISVVVWVFYAYKYPQTPSGQFLIKYRPTQWAFRKEDHSVTSGSRHF